MSMKHLLIVVTALVLVACGGSEPDDEHELAQGNNPTTSGPDGKKAIPRTPDCAAPAICL